jgi:type II secretory pathway pseudopilin PulG
MRFRDVAVLAASATIAMIIAVTLMIVIVVRQRAITREEAIAGRLFQINTALRSYYSSYGDWPPQVLYSDDGRMLHSWRTLVSATLADVDFDVDFGQPWDSEVNKKIAEDSPFVLWRLPGDNYIPTTRFLALPCPKTAESTREDRHSSLLLPWAVVALPDSRVHWMEPRDIDFGTFSDWLSERLQQRDKIHFLSTTGAVGMFTADGVVFRGRFAAPSQWLFGEDVSIGTNEDDQ